MATLRVSNQNQLNEAVNDVNDGDTILLSPGTYSKLDLSKSWNHSVDFNQKVTIASADSSRPAAIQEVFIRDASNIELRGLEFDYTGNQPSSTPSYLEGRPFYIENANKITLDDVTFDGALSGGVGQGRGLRMKNSNEIVIENSEFFNFHNGLDFTNSDNVVIAGNVFRGMGNDGITVGGMHDIRIEDNEFRAFKADNPNANHKDAIQFRLGAGEGTSSDIVIRGNTINISEVVQAIYLGNEMHQNGNNWSAKYSDVLIEDNYIRSAHTHGITVYHGDDITIRNNNLVHNSDGGYTKGVNIPLINVSKFSTNVEIRGNDVRSVQEPQNGTWTVSGNSTNYERMLHWDGNYPSWVKSPTPIPSAPSSGSGGGSNGGSGSGDKIVIGSVSGEYVDEELFRIDARRMDGEDTRFVVERLNFSRDDRLILSMFDEGTFINKGSRNQVAIWNDASAVSIDSARDIQELVRNNSSDISASTNGDELTLRIDRGDDVAQIVLENLGNEFRAANQPELF